MKKILWPAVAALLPFASVANAAPFNSLDARAMGMGDVGVAASQPGSAPIFNSALMSQNADDETVSIILPNVGGSVYADADAMEAFGNIQDEEYLESITKSVDGFNADPANPQHATDLGNATSGFNTELSNLSDKPFNINAGGAFSVVVPTETIGIGVYANAQIIGETTPIITECDTALFTAYSDMAKKIANGTADLVNDYSSNCDGDDRLIYDGDLDVTKRKFIDPTKGDNGKSYLTSRVKVAGVTIAEFGVALSHKFTVNETEFSLGITPKLQEITSYYALPSIADLDGTNDTDDHEYDLMDELDENKKEESAFNFDLGFAMGFLHDDALVVGLTIKDLLGKTYKTASLKSGNNIDCSVEQCAAEFDLKPQARAGVSWELPFGFTVASDLDLTTNKALFNGQDSQYFGVGAEWDIFNVIRLRAGAKTNLEDSDDTALTAGLGFNIIAFHMDFAGQYSDNNRGLALQMGVEF